LTKNYIVKTIWTLEQKILQYNCCNTRGHPEMVGNMSLVTLN